MTPDTLDGNAPTRHFNPARLEASQARLRELLETAKSEGVCIEDECDLLGYAGDEFDALLETVKREVLAALAEQTERERVAVTAREHSEHC